MINDIIDEAKKNSHDSLENVRRIAKKNIPSMTPEQREATVKTVRETGNFFTKLCSFITNMMSRVIDYIKEGFLKVFEVVHDVYQNIKKTLKDAWDEFLDLF